MIRIVHFQHVDERNLRRHKMRNTSGGCMISQIRAHHRDINVKFARCVVANAAAGRNAVSPSLSGSERSGVVRGARYSLHLDLQP
eukprot:2626090-Prymnesium_polylepis.2